MQDNGTHFLHLPGSNVSKAFHGRDRDPTTDSTLTAAAARGARLSHVTCEVGRARFSRPREAGREASCPSNRINTVTCDLTHSCTLLKKSKSNRWGAHTLFSWQQGSQGRPLQITDDYETKCRFWPKQIFLTPSSRCYCCASAELSRNCLRTKMQ